MRHHRQRGQALVETVLVIPILVLMVFGTFYVTYAYMQRSIMNGVAFMAARAVSVRDPGEASGLVKTVAQRMVVNAKLGKSHWLNRAVITGSAAEGVHMEEPDGMWSFLARIVGTTAGASSKHAHVDIRLYPEFERISESGGRTQTYHMISYTVHEIDAYEKALTLVGPILHSARDERIGEPDTFAIAPGAQNGGVDSLGGTIYQRNTAKLDKHKGHIGLKHGAPADNEDKVEPPLSPNSDLTKLAMIGKLFVEIQAGTKLISLAAPEFDKLTAPFLQVYQQFAKEADIVMDKSVSLIQTQETQTLSPGKGL
jgi:hypothetical protein